MLQFLPVAVFYGLKQVAKPEQIGDFVPPVLLSWIPAIAAFLTYLAVQKWNQQSAKQQTSAIIGQEAPDVSIQLKDRNTTLRALIADSKLPALVDFYQNF